MENYYSFLGLKQYNVVVENISISAQQDTITKVKRQNRVYANCNMYIFLTKGRIQNKGFYKLMSKRQTA